MEKVVDPVGRIGMIHQAHFAPWPGYFARLAASNEFVVLDDIQHKTHYFHNRTRIVTRTGLLQWLTLLVARSGLSTLSRHAQISSTIDQGSITRRLRHEYGKDEFFLDAWPLVLRAIADQLPSLLDVNTSIIRNVLGIAMGPAGATAPEFQLSSAITNSRDRNGRVIAACAAAQIDSLLMGADAIISHDLEAIRAAGVRVYQQHHISEIRASRLSLQRSLLQAPIPGVSIFHYASRLGWRRVLQSLRTDWVFVEHNSN